MPFRDIIGHERPKAILRAAMLHDHVAHAYLFYGEDRIGKRLTAIRFAQAINCDTDYGPDSPEACGVCRSCHQIETRIHPDFLLIEPDREQANPQIKIEQIRELESQIIYRPLVGRRKICIIDEADRLTLGAANALLKPLEEPPAQSLFLLVTSRPYALPATVRSRCQGLRFAAPARTQVEAALILKREIPPTDARFLAMMTQARIGQALQTDLEATRAQQDDFSALTSTKSLKSITTLLTAAETLVRANRAPEALEWIARWVRDLVLVHIGADPDNLLNFDRLPALKETACGMPLDALLDLLDDIEAIQRNATRNLNLQMALETVLLRLRDAISVPAQPHSV
ncbi:MAG TPA: DNA polymerase III subunit delta' [Nitrospiraceae bacterium]|nr:DNA polymerase III subunit delta' [Nitrospiraceae bacterium]